MNTITKIAVAAVGTITAVGGIFSAPAIADSFNPYVADMEMGGNVDCEAGTYRPEFGSKLAGELSPFARHEFSEVGAAMDRLAGPFGGLGMIAVGADAMKACSGLAQEIAEEKGLDFDASVAAGRPVAAAPAPVAPPVVAPAPQTQTYSGRVIFNGTPETATITRFNGNSYRVTWMDGYEVTYTLENESQVKVSFVSRGAQTEVWGTYESFNGKAIEVTTENGTTTIPMS